MSSKSISYFCKENNIFTMRNRMYRKIWGICCLVAASLGVYAQPPVEKGLQSISREKAEAIVEFLADDLLLGREAGQPGARIAARYLASELKEAGIRPLAGDSYFQPFEACAVERQQTRTP